MGVCITKLMYMYSSDNKLTLSMLQCCNFPCAIATLKAVNEPGDETRYFGI